MSDQPALPHFPSPQHLPRQDYLPARERPTSRVAEQPGACNLIELLAALIGGPRGLETAEALLAHFGSLRAIRQTHAEELALVVKGIGRRTATRVVAALELGGRLASEHEERPAIHSPADAAALVGYELSGFEQEHLRVILLDTRHRVIGMEDVYKGSLNSALVRVGELFKAAIRRNAAAILIAHGHPSGDPTPSPDDVAITRAIVQAGKLLDTELVDHLIIGHGGRYVSMKEKGLGFS